MGTAKNNDLIEGAELDLTHPPQGPELERFADLLVDCDNAIRYCQTPEQAFEIVFGDKAESLLGFRKGYVGAIDVIEDRVELAYLINPKEWDRDRDKETIENYIGSSRPTFTASGRLMKKILTDMEPYITRDYSQDANISPKLRELINLQTVIVSPFVVFREVVGYVLLGYHCYPSPQVQWMHERLIAHAAMPIMQSSWVAKFRAEVERATKWKVLGQQAGALAHDLKTPIAILGGSLSLLESHIEGEQNKHVIEGAKYQVDRLSSTIANLLSFVKEIDLRIRPVQVKFLIQEAINSSKPQASETLVEGNALDKLIYVDRDKIALVLRNIIDNAYESPAANNSAHRIARVEVNGDDHEVSICVKDNGPGVPKEAMQKIFDPFYSTKREGHGLGLAVSKRFVTEHGGRIHVRNLPEGGASFEIILPWRPTKGGASTKMATVLVVDDNEHFLDLACAIIIAQGHDCLRAKSKDEALQVISARKPDCCILDIRLEESLYGEKKPNGVDLFEEIKTLVPRNRAIFTSAHSDFEEAFLQRRGATGLIDKSNFVRDIVVALREVFYPRVLLVEDNDEFAFVASALLDSRGLKCILITDKEDMQKQVEECDFSTFDAVVADALLSDGIGDFHGWDVVAEIPPSYARESIFLLTGKTITEIEAYLEKSPLTTREQLLANVSRLSENNVLDKANQSWTDAIARVCEARESANG